MTRKNIIFITITILLLQSIFITTIQAITLETTDYISDAEATNSNGFNYIDDGGRVDWYDGTNPYTEDGIIVQQVNGDDGEDIYTGNIWGNHQILVGIQRVAILDTQ